MKRCVIRFKVRQKSSAQQLKELCQRVRVLVLIVKKLIEICCGLKKTEVLSLYDVLV